jgi:hypothetical protein
VGKPKRSLKGAKKPAEGASGDNPPVAIAAALLPIVKAFAKDRQVVVDKGWGAGNTVLKVKGKIFAMTISRDLVVKISKSRAAELVGDGTGTYFDPRHDGRLMKEWIVVEPAKASWLELAREAHQFVRGK